MWVLRHAKAAAHGPDDHGRSLAPKGRRQAGDVEKFLLDPERAPRPLPKFVLCSSALRALETAELVFPALGDDDLPFVVDRRLYQADPEDVVSIVRELDDDVPSVMVVGHNPTLHDLALELLTPEDEAGHARLDQGFPTAALAVVRLPAPRWAEASFGSGELVTVFTPHR